MPASITVSCRAEVPNTSEHSALQMTTALTKSNVAEGEPTELIITVTNTSAEQAPSPIAKVGIPAGLELRHEKLKELVGAGRIAAWEIRDRHLVLYWRQFKAGETRTIPVELLAKSAVKATGPAGCAYLYYTPEHRHWTKPVKVTVNAK